MPGPSAWIAAGVLRFLMPRPDNSQYPKHLVCVHEWPAGLRR
jgi:hypothetical protein